MHLNSNSLILFKKIPMITMLQDFCLMKKKNKKVSVLPVVIHRMELELELELCEMVYFSVTKELLLVKALGKVLLYRQVGKEQCYNDYNVI
jgi:hypothetical protein